MKNLVSALLFLFISNSQAGVLPGFPHRILSPQENLQAEVLACISDILVQGKGGGSGFFLSAGILEKLQNGSTDPKTLLQSCEEFSKNVTTVRKITPKLFEAFYKVPKNRIAYGKLTKNTRAFIERQILPETFCVSINTSVAAGFVAMSVFDKGVSYCVSTTGNRWIELQQGPSYGVGAALTLTFEAGITSGFRDFGHSFNYTAKGGGGIFAAATYTTHPYHLKSFESVDLEDREGLFGLGVGFGSYTSLGLNLDTPVLYLGKGAQIFLEVFDTRSEIYGRLKSHVFDFSKIAGNLRQVTTRFSR